MKAYEIQEFGIENLKLVGRETPKPGAGEVLVKIGAIGLNYRDVMVVEGRYNPKMRLPATPFSDAAGEIVEIGSDVIKWKVGDRVCTTVIPGWIDGEPAADKVKTAIGAGRYEGVLREFGAFHQDAVVAFPSHLSMAEAATLPCAALTAWHALAVSGNVSQGDVVLTLGTGGVSTFALQFAKSVGAIVIITSGSNEKLGKASELKADHLINYRINENWDDIVLDITDGRGADHVIELGGTGTLSRSVRAVRNGGHVALIGALDMSGEFNPVPIFMRNIRLQGIFVGSRSMFEKMNEAIHAHLLRPAIDRVFGFDEVVDALAYMKSRSHFGKIVMEV
jgi:NADPH:quinone reductase-like Zn-dependent oxidoreductase